MHITVTGATGHIGNNLVRLLCSQGHQVRAAFRTTEKSIVLEGLPVEQIVGDILVPEFCNRICKDTEVVVHTAALISIDGDPHGLVHKTNTIGVANIVNSCLKKDVRKLIHLSSIHAFDLAASGPVVKNSVRQLRLMAWHMIIPRSVEMKRLEEGYWKDWMLMSYILQRSLVHTIILIHTVEYS
ncbi:MAG: NAD-dependent epimerase/dehydratase family protein [Saprospiraceae bacterium]|nr:NAD-dependent epimerase/dehydratase family protein [Candidatus Vicinibacter affinis]